MVCSIIIIILRFGRMQDWNVCSKHHCQPGSFLAKMFHHDHKAGCLNMWLSLLVHFVWASVKQSIANDVFCFLIFLWCLHCWWNCQKWKKWEFSLLSCSFWLPEGGHHAACSTISFCRVLGKSKTVSTIVPNASASKAAPSKLQAC